MSQLKRNTSILPPLTPEGRDSKPANLTEVQWWKRLLFLERKRNGQVQTILMRTITNLEQQVADLRGLYLERIALSPTEKK